MMRNICRCPKCGGLNVVARAWVCPNFPPKKEDEIGWIDEGGVFCEDCSTEFTDWECQKVDVEFDPDGDMVRLDDGSLVPMEQWLKDNPVPGDYDTLYGEVLEDDEEYE